jgi:hypothetical protein
MKDFPTIPTVREFLPSDLTWHVFDKIDGSNIRAEWNRKQGFYKFGSRKQLLATDSGLLNESRELVLNKYGDPLSAIFRAQRYESAVAFFEFYGPSSAFGAHVMDEPHKVTLIDVSPYKRGILPPTEFLRHYGHLEVPALIHQGPIDEEFVENVHEGRLEGVTDEGVICKAKADRKTEVPVMCKIKSRVWLDRLRTYCKDDQALFDRLK